MDAEPAHLVPAIVPSHPQLRSSHWIHLLRAVFGCFGVLDALPTRVLHSPGRTHRLQGRELVHLCVPFLHGSVCDGWLILRESLSDESQPHEEEVLLPSLSPRAISGAVLSHGSLLFPRCLRADVSHLSRSHDGHPSLPLHLLKSLQHLELPGLVLGDHLRNQDWCLSPLLRAFSYCLFLSLGG